MPLKQLHGNVSRSIGLFANDKAYSTTNGKTETYLFMAKTMLTMMLFIQYLLVVIVAFLGISIGTVISKFVVEELLPGKRWFIMAKKVLIALIVVALLASWHFIIPIIAAIAVFTALTFLKINDKLIYLLSAALLAISSSNDSLFFVESVLIFLLGIIIASISYSAKESLLKNLKEITIQHSLFIVIAIASYLVIIAFMAL